MVVNMNWDLYKNFSKSEFDCKHTGKNEMRPEFMQVLQEIRIAYNKPMVISSGYRDKIASN
jgi:zinc D-Ala-D-Ala carboxypeptidase